MLHPCKKSWAPPGAQRRLRAANGALLRFGLLLAVALGGLGLLFDLRQGLAAQHFQGILQLRVLVGLLRHVARGAAPFLAVLRLTLEMTAQAGLAGRPVWQLALQLLR